MCGDSDVGEYDRKVVEVDWKHAVDCLHKQNARCSVKECVSVGSTALRAGHVLGDVVFNSIQFNCFTHLPGLAPKVPPQSNRGRWV